MSTNKHVICSAASCLSPNQRGIFALLEKRCLLFLLLSWGDPFSCHPSWYYAKNNKIFEKKLLLCLFFLRGNRGILTAFRKKETFEMNQDSLEACPKSGPWTRCSPHSNFHWPPGSSRKINHTFFLGFKYEIHINLGKMNLNLCLCGEMKSISLKLNVY